MLQMVVLTVWWTQSLYSKPSALLIAAAVQSWCLCALVAWRGSELTGHVSGQAEHLFHIHKRAVPSTSRPQINQ